MDRGNACNTDCGNTPIPITNTKFRCIVVLIFVVHPKERKTNNQTDE